MIMVQQARLMLFLLNMVDYSLSFLSAEIFEAYGISVSAPGPLELIGVLNWVDY